MMDLPTFELTHPGMLYLLTVLPLWLALAWPRAGGGVLFTRNQSTAGRPVGSGRRAAVVHAIPRILRMGAIVSLVLALAGPVRIGTVEEVGLEGKGMALVVDLSSSMLARDMEEDRSRIDVVREAAIRFARGRTLDEMSLVAFGGEALTRVPPTRDPELVVAGVESLEVQMVRDGTDISGAVLTAADRLLESDREPRVLVLLTDGAHNGVAVPPLTAARAAAALGIRIHTIGVLAPDDQGSAPAGTRLTGRTGETMRTVLSGLADLTGGEYYLASSGTALDSIYREIGRLEAPEEAVLPSEERRPFRGELFLLSLALVVAELLIRGSRWGVVP